MRCIVVDDEPLAREGIELLIQDTEGLELVVSFENAIRASAYIQKHEVDLIFLDIQMPGLTGIDFLKMMKINPLVILTTAYAQYALEAYELDVVDYLLKPIKLERFQKAVNKALELHKASRAGEQKEIESIENDFIYIRADRQYVKIYFKDIQFIRGMKDYVMIKTHEKGIMTAMNIKKIGEQLPDSIYCRVSKSYIVNVNKVTRVQSDLLLINEHEIPLGKTYKANYIDNYVKPNALGSK